MAKLTESYLRSMIKQVMKEAYFDENEDDRKFKAKETARMAKEQARFDNFKGGSAFDDDNFGEGKPWEEAMMNLETMVSSYEFDGMASPDDLVQAADDLEALLPSVPRSEKQDVRSLIAAAHEQLAEYQPMPNYIPGGSGAKDPQLSPTMDEARKRKLAQKRRVLKEGFMDKTLDFFGRKHEGGKGIRDRARELRDNPKWNGSNLARTYGKQIIQMINAGDNEAVTYADQLKDIEDQFKRQVGSEDELAGINAETKDSAQKRKDIYNNSIRNQTQRDSDKARNDKEYYGGLRTDNEEREFRGTPEYHDQFRKKVGDQYVAITPDKIKTRPDPRYKGS